MARCDSRPAACGQLARATAQAHSCQTTFGRSCQKRAVIRETVELVDLHKSRKTNDIDPEVGGQVSRDTALTSSGSAPEIADVNNGSS